LGWPVLLLPQLVSEALAQGALHQAPLHVSSLPASLVAKHGLFALQMVFVLLHGSPTSP
jgi:hypothetical protein